MAERSGTKEVEGPGERADMRKPGHFVSWRENGDEEAEIMGEGVQTSNKTSCERNQDKGDWAA